MKGYDKAVRETLREAGYEFARQAKGDHEMWRGPTGKQFAVPVKIISRHTANAILKEAGLPKAF